MQNPVLYAVQHEFEVEKSDCLNKQKKGMLKSCALFDVFEKRIEITQKLHSAPLRTYFLIECFLCSVWLFRLFDYK